MADPWGPGVKRNKESVDNFIKSWNALDTHEWQISSIRDKQGPIYIQEQLQVILNAMDSLGGLHNIVNSSGEITEENSVTINSSIGNINKAVMWDFRGFLANGTKNSSTNPAWDPIPSVVGAGTVITADGAGNIGAAADVIAAVAAKNLDAWLICQVDTTGSYTTKWCEDPTGTPAPAAPDYHTAGHIGYLVAGYPYILREYTPTDNKAFGYDAGVNGNWPNSSNMYITGWSREI